MRYLFAIVFLSTPLFADQLWVAAHQQPVARHITKQLQTNSGVLAHPLTSEFNMQPISMSQFKQRFPLFVLPLVNENNAVWVYVNNGGWILETGVLTNTDAVGLLQQLHRAQLRYKTTLKEQTDGPSLLQYAWLAKHSGQKYLARQYLIMSKKAGLPNDLQLAANTLEKQLLLP